MNIAIGFALTFTWLAAGGWAFAAFLDEPEVGDNVTGALFFFCLILAPFAAGMAVFVRAIHPKQAKERMK